MLPENRSGLVRHALGPVLAGLILIVKAQSETPFEAGAEYPLLVIAAGVSAFIGGFVPAIVVAAISIFYYFYGASSVGTVTSNEILQTSLLGAGLLAVVGLIGVARRWSEGRLADRLARDEAERSEKTLARRVGILGAISVALTESRTIDEAGRRVLEAICESLGWDLGEIWTVDSEEGVMRLVDIWHAPAAPTVGIEEFERSSRERVFSSGEGLVGRVWETGEPLWIPDVSKDDNSPRAPLALRAGLHGSFGFPIKAAGEAVGVLGFFSREIREPDEGLMQMLSSVGSQIGQYLERLRAEEKVRESEALKGAILESAPDCIVTLDRDGRILDFNSSAESTFGYSREDVIGKKLEGTILALPEGPGLDLAASVDEIEEGILGRRLELTSVRADGEEILVELVLREVEPGTASLYTAFLRDITREKRAGLGRSFLSDVGALLTSSLNHEIILRRVAERSVPFLGDCCFIDSIDESGALERAAGGYGERCLVEDLLPFETYLQKPYENHPVVRAIRSGQIQALKEVDASALEQIAYDAGHRDELKRLGLESVVVVPLVGRARQVGAITFLSVAGGRRYDSQDVALMEELASRVGAALDNALLYREKSRIARTLQQSLLPLKLPKIRGLDIAATYHAAGDGHDVGGDFYDVFPYGSHWAVVVGDVSGRGATAAALTGLVRYTVRSEAMQEKEPTKIVSILNEALIAQSREDQFCTLTFARLDLTPQGAHLAVVCAGHPEPIVMRSDGTLEEVPQTSALLGAYPVEVVEQLVDLEKGDSIILYTDGVIEARSDGETFGGERLQAIVAGCLGKTASKIAKEIEKAVLGFAGGPIGDDVAVMVIRIPTK